MVLQMGMPRQRQLQALLPCIANARGQDSGTSCREVGGSGTPGGDGAVSLWKRVVLSSFAGSFLGTLCPPGSSTWLPLHTPDFARPGWCLGSAWCSKPGSPALCQAGGAGLLPCVCPGDRNRGVSALCASQHGGSQALCLHISQGSRPRLWTTLAAAGREGHLGGALCAHAAGTQERGSAGRPLLPPVPPRAVAVETDKHYSVFITVYNLGTAAPGLAGVV